MMFQYINNSSNRSNNSSNNSSSHLGRQQQ